MNHSCIGRTYGPYRLWLDPASAEGLVESLELSSDALADGYLPCGVIPPGMDLIREVFDDLADDGFENHSRRLFAGVKLSYSSKLRLGREYDVEGQILDVQRKRGKTGTFDFGSFSYTYSDPDKSVPILTVIWTFAERQAP